jgi:hypothetical protein
MTRTSQTESAMAAAFMQALTRRVERDLSGQVTLPTGRVDAADVDRVLKAINRVHDEEGNRR